MNYYFTGIDDNYLLKGPPGVQLTDGMLTWTLPQSISTGRYEIELIDKINDNEKHKGSSLANATFAVF